MDFVAEEYRAAPLSDENARKCCLKVSCCTLGRRKGAEVSPKRAVLYTRATESVGFVAEESPSSLRHSVLHLWASIMDRSVTQACRAALSGDKEALKCRSRVPRCTLERQKGAELLLKRAVLHPQATESVGFVAEESPSSLRHSVLHLWASIMDRSVTQACRAALSGDENARKCHPSVPYFTLGRRKSMGFVAEESPSSLRHSVLHLWASIMDRSVTQACRAALSGDENVRKCCLSVPRYTLGRRKCAEVSFPEKSGSSAI